MEHELKTWSVYFDAVLRGDKTFECRKNDRGFREGDTLRLREFDPGTNRYAGRETIVPVVYLIAESEVFGIAPGFVVMGISSRADVARLTRERDEARACHETAVCENGRLLAEAERWEAERNDVVRQWDEEVERFRAVLGRAVEFVSKRYPRHHRYVEDTWYSCPKEPEEGCADDSQGDECNCGADADNEAAAVFLRDAEALMGKEVG